MFPYSRRGEDLRTDSNILSFHTTFRRGYKNIREMLQTIPGYVITTKNSGDYMAQVRGIAANDNKKITLTINGHRIGNLQERIEGIS